MILVLAYSIVVIWQETSFYAFWQSCIIRMYWGESQLISEHGTNFRMSLTIFKIFTVHDF